MSHSGNNLITSVETLRIFWDEAEACQKELWRVLQDPGILNPAVKFVEEIEDASDDIYGSTGWAFDGWHWSFRAIDNRNGPGRKKTIGQLSVQFDIGGERRTARALGFPCIIVAWAHSSNGNWVEEFTDFWPTQAADAILRSDRLHVQKGSDASGPMRSAHWFYILPLISVRNPEALIRLIVKPVFILLENGTVEAAFSNTPEVLRFKKKNEAMELLAE